MTHEELRKIAVRWLTNRHCAVVLSEMVSCVGETPDAVGWHSGRSILIECKVSRSDFLRNKDKPSQRAERCIGRERYFMCPGDIIRAEDLDGTDYGLLSVGNSHVHVVRKANLQESRLDNEIHMLVSALRRVRTREFLTINVLAEEVGEAVGSEVKG